MGTCPAGKKRIRATIAASLLALAAIGLFAAQCIRYERQMNVANNCRIAADFCEKTLEPALRRQARFRRVYAGADKRLEGCISLRGVVASRDDEAELKALVESLNPPRPLRWQIRVSLEEPSTPSVPVPSPS